MRLIEQLLTLSQAYQDATGKKPTTVSWRMFGDSKKLGGLRNGGDIQVKRYEQAMAWLAENWPQNAPWPKKISRHPPGCGCE
jgi:hypothetical protein